MPERSITAKLRVEISDWKSKLREAGQATTNFAKQSQGGFDSLAKSVLKNQQNLNTVARTAGLIGGAVAVGVGAAVKKFADFDQSMSNVAASGKDAKDNIDALRQAAIKAGADTQFSATEAAEAVENLAKAGVSAKDVLGGGLKGALDLAAAGQLDVGEASEIAATALTQFKLSGKDVPHLADLLAAGAGKAQGDVHDLGGALNQAGLVASQFGLSVEDTVGTLSAFASAGLLGSDAGTSFRSMLLHLASPAAKTQKLMDQLGISAYDASGQFVGITGLAQELQTRLGGLTQAQRDSALATIFGTDAIRAANVLYEQGADGIQGWIDKTNDAGYAAETAATKMDNLKGDLEQLSGSLETALIGLGEGSDAPLRKLTQRLTDAVNEFNDLDSGTKTTILTIAGLSAGALLGVAALAKMAVAAAETREALVALNGATGGTIAAFGEFAAKAGTVYAIVASGSLALDQFTTKLGSLTDTTSALSASTDKIDLSSIFPDDSVIDDVVAAMSGIPAGITDINTAMAITSKQGLAGIVNGFTSFRESLLPGTQQLEKYNQGIDQLDQALADMVNSGNAVSAYAAISKLGIDDKYRDRLVKFNAAIKKSGETSADATGPLKSVQQQIDDLSDSADDGVQSMDDLIDAIFGLGKNSIDLSEAQIALEKAIDDATAAADKNTKGTKVGTEAGRKNREVLNGLAQKTIDYTSALIENGKGADKARDATDKGRKAFIDVATQMGFTKKQAEKLADQYGLIPDDVATQVSAPGAFETKLKADGLYEAYKKLPKSKQTEVKSKFDDKGIKAAEDALRKIDGKTVDTYIKTHHSDYYQGGEGYDPNTGTYHRKAAGGLISGPGTATSDSIPARLSAGEFVQKAAAVSAYGADFMAAVNSMRIPRSTVDQLMGRRFASGGLVQRDTSPVMLRPVITTPASSTVDLSGVVRAIASMPAVHVDHLTVDSAKDFFIQAERAQRRARRRVNMVRG